MRTNGKSEKVNLAKARSRLRPGLHPISDPLIGGLFVEALRNTARPLAEMD